MKNHDFIRLFVFVISELLSCHRACESYQCIPQRGYLQAHVRKLYLRGGHSIVPYHRHWRLILPYTGQHAGFFHIICLESH